MEAATRAGSVQSWSPCRQVKLAAMVILLTRQLAEHVARLGQFILNRRTLELLANRERRCG